MENIELLRKRLLYQSQHRGMREMDMLLGRFAEEHLLSMTQKELKQFEALLTFPDDDLYGWFFEGVNLPKEVSQPLIMAIQKVILSQSFSQKTCTSCRIKAKPSDK